MPTMTPIRPLPPLEAATTPAELQDRLSQALETERAALLSQESAAVAARTTTPSTVGPPVEVSPEDFTRTLTAMQAHYAGATATLVSHTGVSERPAPPDLFKLSAALAFRPVLRTVSANGNGNDNEPPPPPRQPPILARTGDAAADSFVADIHSASLALIQQHSNALVAAAKTAQAQNQATAAWLKQMEDSRAAMKASVDREIDTMYNRAAAVANAHPEQRARVLAATNQGNSLFHSLLGGMVGITTTLGGFVGGAAHAVTSTVNAVGSWAAGAVKSVGSFFKHLF